MKNKFTAALANKKGFTLIEIIIVIGLFGFMTALLMQNMFAIYQFKEAISYKKEINFEASSALSNGVAGMIRSGFAIRYEDTEETESDGQSEGLQPEVDQISVYTDRAETQYFTIYREDYTASGDLGDTARLMVKYSTGEVLPLHSSEVVIEDFDIEVPTDPRSGGDRDIHPYVSIKIKARHRYRFMETPDEDNLRAHENIRTSYQTTYTLRNNNPASYKAF